MYLSMLISQMLRSEHRQNVAQEIPTTAHKISLSANQPSPSNIPEMQYSCILRMYALYLDLYCIGGIWHIQLIFRDTENYDICCQDSPEHFWFCKISPYVELSIWYVSI